MFRRDQSCFSWTDSEIMSQDSYWTMTALGTLFGVDMLTVRRSLQKCGLVDAAGTPTAKAEKDGYVRRFWRNKEEYSH